MKQATPRREPHADDTDAQDETGAWVTAVVDQLPPLTEAQKELLALIFRTRQRKNKK